MVKILPSIPVNAIPQRCLIKVEEATLDDLKTIGEAVVYIRHQPTLKVLEKHIPRIIESGNANATITNNETFFVVALPVRQPVPGQDVEVNENELLVRRVTVLPLI